jgi:hypothetical protein
MKDTEPMPALAPHMGPAPEPPGREPFAALRFPRPSLGTSLVMLSAVFALLFVTWTHYEFASLRAEVREARVAAEAATRAADRATLAARAAQSALASNDTPNTANDDGTSAGSAGGSNGSSDAQQPTNPDSQ